jgi:hypothetical protein
VKFVKHFNGVASYKSFGTPGLVAFEKGALPASPILEDPQPKRFPQIVEAFWQSDLIHQGSTPRHPTNRNPFLTTQAA